MEKVLNSRKLVIEAHAEPSRLASFLLPVLAISLTIGASIILFSLLGKPPLASVRAIFFAPLLDGYSRPEILVKSSPLLLIATGLAIGFRANIWNIGAEGQFIMGGIGASAVALAFYPGGGAILLPLMVLGGALAGLLWALIPALLKIRFQTSEILVSLMLVYVAELFLRIMVSGALQDPEGLSFPKSRSFQEDAILPLLIGGTRVHIGVLIALILAGLLALFMKYHRLGFDMRVAGASARAARFSGANHALIICATLGLGGALAGLAGMFEVAGPVGQLTPALPSGYGFTAIIVAFLGRLNPWGIIVAALAIGITSIGGETAQVFLQLPAASIKIIQGMMLFILLAVEGLSRYRIRIA